MNEQNSPIHSHPAHSSTRSFVCLRLLHRLYVVTEDVYNADSQMSPTHPHFIPAQGPRLALAHGAGPHPGTTHQSQCSVGEARALCNFLFCTVLTAPEGACLLFRTAQEKEGPGQRDRCCHGNGGRGKASHRCALAENSEDSVLFMQRNCIFTVQVKLTHNLTLSAVLDMQLRMCCLELVPVLMSIHTSLKQPSSCSATVLMSIHTSLEQPNSCSATVLMSIHTSLEQPSS